MLSTAGTAILATKLPPPHSRAARLIDRGPTVALKRYVIEREIPNIGASSPADLSGASATSNSALAQLAPRVQWEHSYVADNKTFCVYLAENEKAIRDHAEISGFPATKITEVRAMIDPTSAT